MDTAASCRLLSPASSSPPPCPKQLPKRRPTFAASQQQSPSSSAKFRLCLLHDKSASPTTSVQMQSSQSQLQRLATVLQCGAVWAAVEAPAALAVTGEEDIDLLGILPPLAVFAFFYFLVAPPVIMNWMRLRWYKREFVETYLQFMFTYLFYPAMMFWAPFVNFRKFPRDPTMKYPWSKPKEGTPLFKDRYPPIDS
ncbi:NAD(P)H-quinone oxidoreductase subunit L, chloroplastic [Zea mays]|uniref:NAD(P)H-quinone oxidoreductase subunit L, chloroplastic n=1 Tax=Zea mays TaxID=4577 RepID=A0A3L6DYD0_MAIZE|nr:NAD(P)H-quinone oxidoreductase subunit L, chloroplastic [Zea mays]